MHLSERLQQFILRYIHSIDQLEMLLMMHREPAREWTADEMTRALFSERESVASRLQDLQQNGVITAKETSGRTSYRYGPSAPELEKAIAELARDYPTYRVSIINLIFSKPIDRIRTFADAFRFKKDDDDEDKK